MFQVRFHGRGGQVAAGNAASDRNIRGFALVPLGAERAEAAVPGKE